ncbi:energy-coupling factor transporter transmembrane component T [Nocardioides sp. GCM10027113]|uniref:energy-coupling factor transporter transmembrane component T n=1 Tax=unclassified Nocardioides TaxID=2615069 RepID=UPI00361043F6
MVRPRLRRDLHPVAWWVWAIALAAAASFTTNPLVLLLVLGAVAVVVAARRGDQPWSRSFRIYVWVGVVIVAIRVAFRIVFGVEGGTVLLDLPEIPLPGWVDGVRLLGPLTLQALLAGLYDGLRLATIVICVGAANSLANPKRLLRSVPPALYEVGTALVVAVTVLPQFADSVRRVRAAQGLRAGATSRTGRFRRTLVPVLEDALERSLALAAGMDTRGYGRSGAATPAERRRTGALMLSGVGGLCVGIYAVLDTTAPRYLAAPMLLLGVLAAVVGIASAGRRVRRTRYRADRWRVEEVLVAASGLLAGVAAWSLADRRLDVVHPTLDAVPPMTLLALAPAALGLLGGLCAPAPPLADSTPQSTLQEVPA